MADWKIIQDHTGEAVAVEIEGKEYDLEDSAFLPSRKGVEEVRDLKMHLASTHEELKDSYDSETITTRIEATHGGYVNRNNYFYVADGMKRSIDTWTTPMGAPYILNHNMREDARGRVQSANHVKTGMATCYHDLDVEIGHDKEIEMVIDGRALAVSAGASAVDTVECSVCGQDLYRDGKTPKTYTIDEKPSREWLGQSAPGMMGAFGMTNEDFWNVQPVTSEDGERVEGYQCSCHHMRKSEAPMGADDFQEIHWKYYELDHRELSRVNDPADINKATGEFAHIREILKQTDGLDEDTRAKHLVEKLSKIDAGAVDRARYSVLSEKQLFRPTDANEAVDYVNKAGDQVFWNRGLWLATCNMAETLPMSDRVEAYYKAGGRFVTTDAPGVSTDTRPSAADALKMKSTDFYAWLRTSDYGRDTKASLEHAYMSRYMRELKRKRGSSK